MNEEKRKVRDKVVNEIRQGGIEVESAGVSGLWKDKYDGKDEDEGGKDLLCELICECIEESHVLQSFSIRDRARSTGEKAVERLATAVGKSTSLNTLNIIDCQIGAPGTEAIAAAVGKCSTLTKLAITSAGIGESGAKALAGVLWKLTELDISGNYISCAATKVLAEALGKSKTMKTLRMRDWMHGDALEDLAGAMKACTTLTTLGIPFVQLGYARAELFPDALTARRENMISMDLSGNDIRDECALKLAAALGECKCMTTLDLSFNRIGKDGVVAIANAVKTCTTMTTLDLGANASAFHGTYGGMDALAAALKDHPSMTTLGLGSNRIEDDCAILLAGALMDNRTMKTLNLCYNFIGAAGVTALANAVKTSWHMETLDLSSNASEDLHEVAEALDYRRRRGAEYAVLSALRNPGSSGYDLYRKDGDNAAMRNVFRFIR
jgi:Ran GTPase-activating protein (RanGAP) involved in mRNA processing and transport